MAQVQYAWDEGLVYYHLCKPFSGSKQDIMFDKLKGSTPRLAKTSTHRATEIFIILQQAHLIESNKNQ